MLEHASRKYAINGEIIILVAVFAVAGASFIDPSSNMSDIMCQPPVLLFYAMSVGGTDIVLNIGGLNETSPLFGVFLSGDPWNTKWVNLTRQDPEIQFLLDQDRRVNLMKAYFGNGYDFVGLRYECPVTRTNFTCIVKFTLEDETVELTTSGYGSSPYHELENHILDWLNVDILKNHSEQLADKWEPTCTKIANVSDPGHMSLSTTSGDGWTTCDGSTPTPTRFWISVNDSGTVVSINSTYTKNREVGSAFLNISTSSRNLSCSASSVLGWTVIANQTETIHELPTLAKLIGDSEPGLKKEGCGNGGQNYDFLIVVIMIFLILAVVYLFFKNQIHAWIIENVLNRFGSDNKPASPVSHAEFQPMI